MSSFVTDDIVMLAAACCAHCTIPYVSAPYIPSPNIASQGWMGLWTNKHLRFM